jgi:hypothetical protein
MIRSEPAAVSWARLSTSIALRATDESPWGTPYFECKAGALWPSVPKAAYRQVCKRHMTQAISP